MMKVFVAIVFGLIPTLAHTFQFPHELNWRCSQKMKQLGFDELFSQESCRISAGESCSEPQAALIQFHFPECVGEVIYIIGRQHSEMAAQFCNMAARRRVNCQVNEYLGSRSQFTTCVEDKVKTLQVEESLLKCLEHVHSR